MHCRLFFRYNNLYAQNAGRKKQKKRKNTKRDAESIADAYWSPHMCAKVL
jgi:hypothetical protein